jgi:hypothetical protein
MAYRHWHLVIRFIWLTIATLFSVGVLTAPKIARPAPPEHADPALAPWFEGLRAPLGGMCCAQIDGRTVGYRIVGDHFEAQVGQQFPLGPDPPIWIAVPADHVLQHQQNPTGRAVLFWTPALGVLCSATETG